MTATLSSVAVPLRAGVPLTPMQRVLWASQRREPTSPLQNMALLSHLEAEVDAERLARAFASVVAASDTLRSRIVVADGVSVARVAATPPAESEIIDLDRDAMAAWARRRVATPLDLGRAGYDSVVLRHPDGTVSWYLCLHHSLTDATSSQLVFDATATAYHEGEPPPLASYYAWAAGLKDRGGAASARAERHWARRSAAPRVGRLYRPVRRPTPVSERVGLDLDDDLFARVTQRLAGDLRMLSDDLGWTTLLVTVAALYLHRLTGAERFSLGVPVHNRSDAAARSVIGPVMETFPVDVTVEEGDTYRSLHRRVGRSLLTTLRHAVAGTAPAAEVDGVVNVIPRAGLGSFGPVPATTTWIHPGASDPTHLFRLQLTSYGGDRPSLVLDLNEAAAAAPHRARAAGHVRAVLADLLDDPDAPIGRRTLCGPDEAATIERWSTGPAVARLDEPLLPQQLATVLPATASVVLVDGDRSWTGPALWAEVTTLAARLSAAGIGRGQRVAIDLPRSAEAVIAILATSVAGGSYVPLDPTQPAARRQRLAERAGCACVLDGHTDLPEATSSWAPPPVAPGDEAYLLFTSGSTGEPKGVPITHGGLAQYLRFAGDAYVGAPDAPAPVAPLFSALTFDLTVTSLFLPLLRGGRLVVIGEDGPAAMRAVAERPELTWCKATPSHLELLVRMLPAGHALATLVVGGEAFPARLAADLRAALGPEVRIFNEYGPTEAVVGCMIHEATEADPPEEADVPIGRPAPGVRLRIVDRSLCDVPVGGVGELLISHDGVTSGYLGGDGAEKFVLLDGRRYYRSGDLVRLVDDATLTYEGRADDQVKVGGIRLEPNEVAAALAAHPAVDRAAVRLWSPSFVPPTVHCVRCGLPANVPGVTFDDAGVCSTCHTFDSVKDRAAAYFGTVDDLLAWRDRARAARTGDVDCVHLLSGGKDSTYALYQLVALGFDVHALTLDNGYISEGAKENIRRSIADLGIPHTFATTDAMDEIFRDSLARYSNVCNGCYKTIYTLATNAALELGAPLVVTGLSRGQLFETRLVPAQFSADRFDPEAIDRAVLQARKAYHRSDDAVAHLLDVSCFATDEVFDRVQYVDFYRYLDVELAEVLEFLRTRAPWVRPADTGRSTNCLINAAGIATHQQEQGYHNYAVPYAWDVRLGHKTRDEAIEELDDRSDPDDVAALLGRVGYEPRPREVLTAWYTLAEGREEPTPAELRTFLAGRLPAYAIPQAFVAVDELPVTTNGKLDTAALPAPRRLHRQSATLHLAPESPTERLVVSLWERVLGIEPIGVEDDFFDLGGDSLAALQMVTGLSAALGHTVREELAFVHRTPRALAAAVTAATAEGDGAAVARPGPSDPLRREPGTAPVLSIGEQSMLFEYLAAPLDPAYNVARRYRVEGEVDADRFVDAVGRVIERHTPLHWTYGEPRRRLAIEQALTAEVGREPVRPEVFAAAARALHVAPFDLEAGPLVRVLVQPIDDGTTGIALVFHHIAVDAGSLDRFWAKVETYYRGDDLPDPGFDYGEHAAWQAARLVEADIAFWSSPEVARPTAEIELSAVAPADPRRQRPGGGYRQRRASSSAEELRVGPGATVFATALAAVAAVLRARADGDSIGIGITASTRDHPGAERLVGFYLNTLPLVVDVGLDDGLGALGRRCSETIGAALSHRTYPFARIVADRRRAGLPAPTVDVLLAYEELAAATLGGLRADHEILSSGSSVAPATFFVQVRGSVVDLGVEFRHDTLTEADADALLAELDEVLRRSIERPADTVVTALPAAAARRTELPPRAWLGTTAPLSPHRTLDELLRAGAAGRDDAPAVRIGARVLSHAELTRRADGLARRLVALGAGPGTLVGVEARRDLDLVVALRGVLAAGAAYVPLDPDYPVERLRHIVADCGLRLVVRAGVEPADSPLAADAQLWDDLTIVELDDSTADAPPAHGAGEADLAYVIHTSGSTGLPKGVAITNRNIVESTSARFSVYPTPVERFLLLSSFAFDSSMVGLWWTLACGGTIVLPEPGRHLDVVHLAEVIERDAVTDLLALPSLYLALLEENAPARLRSLRRAIVAGETCTPAIVRAHRAACGQAALWNEYGPTEATVWSHAFEVPADLDEPVVPIGRPVPNTTVAVLDDARRPVSVGRPGELYLGGIGLSPGYLGRDDLTAERFVTLEPDGARWYRTGDLVRWQADGTLVFVGRVDHQLKLRGHRIEPEEVEAVLVGVPGVREAAVSVRGDGGSARLVAFVAGTSVDVDRVLTTAREVLPAHEVPAAVVVVDAVSTTANGKLDRDALAALPVVTVQAAGRRGGAGPRTAEEVAMATLWAEALGVDEVGLDDDFFDLGGHSLLAIRLFARITKRFGVDLSLAVLFQAPTPRALLAHVTAERAEPHEPAWVHLVPITEGDPALPPLFCVHGLGGNVLNLRGLAVGLGEEWGFVGIQAAGVDGIRPFHATMDELCDAYLAELLAYRPDGPFLLGGYSNGGLIAIELAQRLTALGREVLAVVLLDTIHPDAMVPRIPLPTHVRELRRKGPRYLVERVVERRQRAARHRSDAGLDDYVDVPGEPAPWDVRERRLFRHNLELLAPYRPLPYEGRVVVVAATDDWKYQHLGPDRGWSGLLPQVEIVPAPGDHVTLLDGPNAGALASGLRTSLERIVRRPDDDADWRLAALVNADRLASAVRDGDLVAAPVAGALAALAAETIDRYRSLAAALDGAGVGHRPTGAISTLLTEREPLSPRLLVDIDVEPGDAARAAEVAAGLGYRPWYELDETGWKRALRLGSALPLVGESASGHPVVLHIHWRAGGPRIPRLAGYAFGSGIRRSVDLGPFLATPTALVPELLAFAEVGVDDVVLDLGSGDGRLVVDAALTTGCRGIGVELDPGLVARAQQRALDAGVADRVRFVCADADTYGPSEATVVLLFVPAHAVPAAVCRLRAALRPGARVVAHEQARIPMAADRRRVLVTDGGITVAHRWDV